MSAGLSAVVLVLATPWAWGFWTVSAAGAGAGTTGGLTAPGAPQATRTALADTVHLTWTAAATSTGAAATGYVVTRVQASDGSAAVACGTTPQSPTSELACDDQDVPDGTFHYEVMAIYGGWTEVGPRSEPVAVVADRTAPSVSASASESANENGYYSTSPVTVTLTASDDGSGEGDDASGVATISYQLDGLGPVTVESTSVPITVAGDGDHTLTFFATDAAGNRSLTGSVSVRIDTTGPGVTVRRSDTQPSHTRTGPVRFAVTFTEPVTGFTDSDITLAGTAEPTTAHVEPDGTGAAYAVEVSGTSRDGTVVVSVPAAAAADLAGNPSTASTGTDNTVTIDAAAVMAPSQPELAESSDTGRSPTDRITKDATPTFTGTADPGALVTVYADGIPVGSGSAGGGTYSITTDTLTDGARTITADAADAEGKTGPLSTGTTVTVDTVAPPAASAPAPTEASDTGLSGDLVTADATPTVTGTAETGSLVRLYADGSPVSSTEATDGSYTFTAPALADGDRGLTADATDAAGNTGPSSTGTVLTIDTAAPVVVLASFTANSRRVAASGTAGRLLGDEPTVRVSVCAGTGPEGTSQPGFPCADPAATMTAAVDALTGDWTVTSDALSTLTTYYAVAEQVDLAGNIGTSPVSAGVTTGGATSLRGRLRPPPAI